MPLCERCFGRRQKETGSLVEAVDSVFCFVVPLRTRERSAIEKSGFLFFAPVSQLAGANKRGERHKAPPYRKYSTTRSRDAQFRSSRGDNVAAAGDQLPRSYAARTSARIVKSRRAWKISIFIFCSGASSAQRQRPTIARSRFCRHSRQHAFVSSS